MGATARAQNEGEATTRCEALVREAQALAASPRELPDGELRARGTALLDHARDLEALRVRGTRLSLPWIAEAKADFAPEPNRSAEGRSSGGPLVRGLEPNRSAEGRSSGGPLVRGLERDRTSLEAAARRLAGRLLFSCGVALRRPDAPATVDRERLVSILSRPEYVLRSRDETLLNRLLTRILNWFRDVFSASEGVRESVALVRTAFLLGACLLAALLALRMARAFLARRHPAAPGTQGVPLALDDPEAYQRRAGEALAQSEGREAIRLGLLTLLSTLERLRLAAPGRAATNREVADQIAARGGGEELAQRTRELVAYYDRAWYGLQPVDAPDARAFVDRATQLSARAAAERGGAP